jgi:hypothetical protein
VEEEGRVLGQTEKRKLETGKKGAVGRVEIMIPRKEEGAEKGRLGKRGGGKKRAEGKKGGRGKGKKVKRGDKRGGEKGSSEIWGKGDEGKEGEGEKRGGVN